jgi:hypothetical protein
MIEHRPGLGVEPLAQRRAGRQQLDAQRLLEERVAAESLHGVEVALALHQQTDVAAHDVAAAHAAAHRQRRIEPAPRRLQRLQVVTHQRQSGHRREVVGQLLDLDSAHGAELSRTAGRISARTHPQGKGLSR